MAETVDMLVCSGLKEQYKVEKVKLGRLQDDEILVLMRATGVCHTDFACCNVLPRLFKAPHSPLEA